MSATGEQIPTVEIAEKATPHETLMRALLAVQAEAPKISKDAENPHFKSKFASLDAVMNAVGPILARHGLVWLTLPGREDGEPVLAYKMVHAASGETLEGSMPLMLKTADPQGQGSALTYARRYSIMAVLGLVPEEDDDGNRAQSAALRSPFGPTAKPEVASSARKAVAWMLDPESESVAVNGGEVTALLTQIEKRAGGYLPNLVALAVGHVAAAAKARRVAQQGADLVKPGEGDPAVETDDERQEREKLEAIAAEHGAQA